MVFLSCDDSNDIGSHDDDDDDEEDHDAGEDLSIITSRRRAFLTVPIKSLVMSGVASAAASSSSFSSVASAAASTTDDSISSSPRDDLLRQVQQASKQLEPVPQLIKDQKWDAVRAILLEPPLVDRWKKTNRPLLQKYAEIVDDELAALEAKEDLVSHLRYLDMAVYNNVFNPIATEGQTAATKELVRSYYEDPINEYKLSMKAFDELIHLTE